MAESVLLGMGKETGVDLLDSGVSRRAEDSVWVALSALVKEQRETWDRMLLNEIGHGNPNVMKRDTLSFEAAKRRAEEINLEIQGFLEGR